MPNPGQMDHLITVVGLTLVDRPDGGQTPVEVTVIDGAPCEFIPVSFEERMQASVQYATATAHAVLWFDRAVNVTPAMKAAITDPQRGLTTEYEIAGKTETAEDLDLLLIERVT
jgi:hypothetical protein